MKILSANHQQLFASFSLAFFLSACASHVPAPIENTVVIGNHANKNRSNPELNKANRKNQKQHRHANSNRLHAAFDGYVCEDAPTYLGKSIGDGECVDLIKLCSNAPLTRYWKPGDYAFGKDIPAGTAIATFRKGKYPSRSGYHAAIYSHQDKNGIYAWDQWQGQPVHLRYIQANQRHKDAGNDASRYRIIKR